MIDLATSLERVLGLAKERVTQKTETELASGGDPSEELAMDIFCLKQVQGFIEFADRMFEMIDHMRELNDKGRSDA